LGESSLAIVFSIAIGSVFCAATLGTSGFFGSANGALASGFFSSTFLSCFYCFEEDPPKKSSKIDSAPAAA
jgi:hypothetical protein